MIKPLEILTENLLTSKECEISENSQNNLQIYQVLFTQTQQADTLILKNINAEEVSFYIVENEEPVLIKSEQTQGNNDLIIRLDTIAQGTRFKLTLLNNTTQGVKVLLCKSLLTLNNALSRITRSDFKKEGYHYLANGKLVKWNEIIKFGCGLSLKNLDKATRDTLIKHQSENPFLTYIFYGEYDTSSCYELTPQSTPSESFDRKTALYELDFNLLEK